MQVTGDPCCVLRSAAVALGCALAACDSAPPPPTAAPPTAHVVDGIERTGDLPAPALPPPAPPGEHASSAELPVHQYAGVAGLRAVGADGKCPAHYRAQGAVCVHARLRATVSDADLARLAASFEQGAAPPIVADAPAPGPREPGAMRPGALLATPAQLAAQAALRQERARRDAQRAEIRGRATQPPDPEIAAEQAASPPPTPAPATGSAGGPIGSQPPASGEDAAQVQALMQQLRQLHALGGAQSLGSGQIDPGQALQLLQQLQPLTDGAAVDPATALSSDQLQALMQQLQPRPSASR